jgi:hypothetical protein
MHYEKKRQKVIELFTLNPKRPTREVMELVRLNKNQVLGIKHRANLCQYSPHLQDVPKVSSYKHVKDKEYKPYVSQYALSKARLIAALKINLSVPLEKTKFSSI